MAGIHYRLIWLLALWLLGQEPTFSAPANRLNQYNFKVIKEGLPQSSVKAILQTSDGYLWFGTRFGLVRFDGVTLTVFGPGSNPALEDGNCGSLMQDRLTGGLWIGRRESVCYFDGQRFANYDINAGAPEMIIRQMDAAIDGGLWLASTHGLLKFKDGRITQRFGAETGLLDDEIQSVFVDTAGLIWLGLKEGLQRLDPKTGRTEEIKPGGNLSFRDVRAIRRYGDQLWVLAAGGIYVREREQWRHYSIDFQQADLAGAFLLKDSTGKVWAGTNLGALYSFEDGAFQKAATTSPLLARALTVFEDREANLWVGTPFGGVVMLQLKRMETIAAPDGLVNENVWSIHESSDGTFWFGCDDGISRLKDGVITSFPSSSQGGINEIKSIFQDSRGDVWVGTKLFGFQRFANGQWEHVPLPGSPSNNEVTRIFGSSGITWLFFTG